MAVTINKGRAGGIDMTPMIDVIFQLLIFFLVATKIDEQERSLKVVLPTASEAKPLTAKPDELLVSITKTGKYLLNNREATLANVEQIFLQAVADNPDRVTVRIRADQDAAHRYVVAVINGCLKSGIKDYRIDTKEGP